MQVSIIISFAVVVAACGFIATVFAARKKKPVDYYALFLIGILWVAAGSFFMIVGNFNLNALYAMGIIFAIAGLAHRKDWHRHKAKWHELTEHEKKVRLVIVIALGVLVLIGVLFNLLIRSYLGGI